MPAGNRFELALIFSDNNSLSDQRQILKKMNILPERHFWKKWAFKKAIDRLNRRYSEYKISKNDFDLFHPTYYDNYFFKTLRKPYIITVHDLIEFKIDNASTESAFIRPQMEKAIKNANRIIAISENTKKDIVEIFGLPLEKIDVIHHGYNQPCGKKQRNEYGRYILFVGNRDRYKNFDLFVRAVGRLFERDKDLQLVCVGRSFRPEEVDLLREVGIGDRATACHVDETSLNNLYANALVFVYPSLYEGFGMPVLEAFANECPVCLSNTSSLPEVAGDAGVYFDPRDPDSMSAAVERVVYDRNFANEVIEHGRNRLKKFSWEKATEQTILSYHRAIS